MRGTTSGVLREFVAKLQNLGYAVRTDISDRSTLEANLTLPGVLDYGDSRDETRAGVKVLAPWVLAEQIEQGQASAALDQLLFREAA